MSLRETDVRELAGQDHEVLGSEFCSGYTDIFGKWNTGFDCPRMGNGETVYCCGTIAYKYCCTRRDHHSGSSIGQSVLLGSALGSVLMIVLVFLVSCFICRRYVPYRRAHPSLNGGPLYTMHCSSTASGMYAFSGQPSSVTTPLDGPHVLVDLDNSEHAYTIPISTQRVISRHLAAIGCEAPSDPPPPYNEASAAPSEGSTVQENSSAANSFDLPTSTIGLASQRCPANNSNRRTTGSDPATARKPAYWCTKF